MKEVFPIDDHTLFLVFENDAKSVLDIKPILNFGGFQRLKEYEAFRQVRIGFDTIEWDGGVYLDPEYVYSKYTTHAPA